MTEATLRHAFRLTADPAALWRHGQYVTAFEALRAAVLAGESYVVLTGDVGTGKTTLANALAQRMVSDGAVVGRLMYGCVDAGEMWSALARALDLEGLRDRAAFLEGGRDALRAACAGQTSAVAIVDEAQSLDAAALNELGHLARVLSPGDPPVLSIVLVGQPELLARLQTAECEVLAQRIGTRANLVGLSVGEVAPYIHHRLETACATAELFPAGVISQIATRSGGIPRRINQMCHGIVAAAAASPTWPDEPSRPAMVRRAADRRRWTLSRIGLVGGAAVGLAVAILVGWLGRDTAPPRGGIPAGSDVVRASYDATPVSTIDNAVAPPAPIAERSPMVPSQTPETPAANVETVTSSRSVTPSGAKSTTPPVAKDPPRRSAPPARATTTPQRQSDEPDPSDVIDWLLKEGSRVSERVR